MSADQPQALIQCPGCGKMVSGQYCSYCGTYLLEDPGEKKHPFLSFVTHFLNIENISHYLKLYFTILRSPVANTIRINKEIFFETSVKFMEYSVTIYTLFAVTKSFLAPAIPSMENSILGKWGGKIDELVNSLFIVASYLIILKLFYRWSSKRFGPRDKRDFIKLYCLYAGFYLPIYGVAFLIFGSPLAWEEHATVSLTIVKVVTYFFLNIAVLIHGFRVWGEFWHAPGNKVISLLMFAGLTSFVIFFVAKIVIYASLDIDF